MDFHLRNWTLELEPEVPAYLPVPSGCPCIINGIFAKDASSPKIRLEAKTQVFRLDRLEDESDIAQTEIISSVLATVFPSINPSLSVHIEFSKWNLPSVCAYGGGLVLNGIYDNSQKISGLDLS